MLGLGEHGDERGEAGDVGVCFVEAESACLPVGVLLAAGELAVPVFVGDTDGFQVSQDVGREGEEGVSQQRWLIGHRLGYGCWLTRIIPSGATFLGNDTMMAAGAAGSQDGGSLGDEDGLVLAVLIPRRRT